MKKWFAVIGLFLFALPFLSAQCIKGNCQNGKGAYVYKSGAKYVGSFRRAARHGIGTLYYSNGKKYEGMWKTNYQDGKGKVTFPSGNVYEGDFRKGKKTGFGTMRFANQDIYEGNWDNGMMQGEGKYQFANGDKYIGNFYQDKFHGEGKYYVGGSVVLGPWKHGESSGMNVSTTVQNNTNTTPPAETNVSATTAESSSSTAKDNYPDCTFGKCHDIIGIYKYAEGSEFIGEFKNGQPQGQGTCYYANGDKYVGGWRSHAPHGKGILYYKNGRVSGGSWQLGTLVKRENPTDSEVGREYVKTDNDKAVKVWAVIVGVGRYPHMQALKYTDDDAYQIYAFLRSPEGGAVPKDQIRVLIDEDATRGNIVRAMRQVFLKADENDVVMMYFSGHGLDGSFIPVDFDGYNNRLTHQEVKQILNESKAKHKIVYADACHSGSMLAAKGNYQNMLDKYYKAFEDSRGGIALMMSSKGEETSLEAGNLRQGVYSHFLIRGLNGEADTNRDKIVSIRELYNFVYKNVRQYTVNSQSPTLQGQFDDNMPVAVIRD